MNIVRALFRRELQSYFATPVAYVFIVIFLVLMGTFTFYLGGFYEQGQADLRAFFNFHPWLYLFLVPAISMRLWAEERKSGSVELLMTLPITPWQAVLGKYLAAWAFTGIALALTFPIWLTVNYLGDPDNGAIFAGLRRQLPDGRRLPGYRLLPVGLYAEPGHRVRHQHCRLFWIPAIRIPDGAQRIQRLGAAGHHRHDRFIEFPHAFLEIFRVV